MLNMAIIVYLQNQNVFYQRGVRAQIGYMGGWIELIKNKEVNNNTMRQTDLQAEASFKRNLEGLQSGGIYMGRTMLANAGSGGLGQSIGPSGGSKLSMSLRSK